MHHLLLFLDLASLMDGHSPNLPYRLMIRRSALETALLSYLFPPMSIVLLEKLTCSQLVKKFPAFSGTRRFITSFTHARQLFLS